MPFDAENLVVYGHDARRVRTWARQQLLTYIRAALNDSSGPYYEAMGLSASRKAIVTGNAQVAQALYKGAGKNPVVFGMLGESAIVPGGKRINGSDYKGVRHAISFLLDGGVSDPTPAVSNLAADTPADRLDADSEVMDFVFDIIERGKDELAALGLSSVRITPDAEAQRRGEGRNPHRVTCLVVALDNYVPPED